MTQSRRNKSATIRKYELAYESCLRRAMKKSSKSTKRNPKTKCLKKLSADFVKSLKIRSTSSSKNSPKEPRRRKIKSTSKKVPKKSLIKSTSKRVPKKSRKIKSIKTISKKSLNPYQKFVREQSKKSAIKRFSPNKRLKEISKLWRNKK